jgi:hypothetical protein
MERSQMVERYDSERSIRDLFQDTTVAFAWRQGKATTTFKHDSWNSGRFEPSIYEIQI